LDAKATKCIFIRYCSEFKAYKLFDPSTHKVFVSRDVLFHEKEAGNHDDNSHEEWQRLLDEGFKEEQLATATHTKTSIPAVTTTTIPETTTVTTTRRNQ
jgi:hypothetical protein